MRTAANKPSFPTAAARRKLLRVHGEKCDLSRAYARTGTLLKSPFSQATPIQDLRDVAGWGPEVDKGIAKTFLHLHGQVDPCDNPFPWGTVLRWHEVGDYSIAEYQPDHAVWRDGVMVQAWDRQDEIGFHPYVRKADGRWDDTHRTFSDIDSALAFCIAYKAEGPNTKASVYFMRSLRSDD